MFFDSWYSSSRVCWGLTLKIPSLQTVLGWGAISHLQLEEPLEFCFTPDSASATLFALQGHGGYSDFRSTPKRPATAVEGCHERLSVAED